MNNIYTIIPTISSVLSSLIKHVCKDGKTLTFNEFMLIIEPSLIVILPVLISILITHIPLITNAILEIVKYIEKKCNIVHFAQNKKYDSSEIDEIIKKKFKGYYVKDLVKPNIEISNNVFNYSAQYAKVQKRHIDYDLKLDIIYYVDLNSNSADNMFALLNYIFMIKTSINFIDQKSTITITKDNDLNRYFHSQTTNDKNIEKLDEHTKNIIKKNIIEHKKIFSNHYNRIKNYLKVPYLINDDLDMYIIFDIDEENCSYVVKILTKAPILMGDIYYILSKEVALYEINERKKYDEKTKKYLLMNDNNNLDSLNRYYNEHIDNIKTMVRKFKEFSTNKNIRTIPCSFCFAGPYGCGKTGIAKAIANELERKVVELNLGSFKYEEDLHEFIFNSNDYKKTVFVADEIDLVCPNRDDDCEIEKTENNF